MKLNTYAYRQNNSGGFYDIPYIYVLVEAYTADEANKKAQEVGVYFDPTCFQDCECCGPRWDSITDGYSDNDKRIVYPGSVDKWVEVNKPYNPKISVLIYKIDGTIIKTIFEQLTGASK